MKKVLVIAAMATMVPFSAYAKTAITDSDMNKVTGQAGVSIDVDINMNITADTFAWGNSDGLANGKTSWIGMTGFNAQSFTVQLRPDLLATLLAAQGAVLASGGVDPGGLLATAVTNAETAIRPFSIDVKTGGTSGSGASLAGITYVHLGLGSLEIGAKSVDFNVALGSTSTGTTPTWSGSTIAHSSATDLNQELGSVHMGNLLVDLNGGSTVDIYSTNPGADVAKGSGVVFDMNVTIDKIAASAISWGNKPGALVSTSINTGSLGAAPTTTAGYVGLANLNIATMTVVGPVSIQVATVNTSTATLNKALDTINSFTTGVTTGGGTSTYHATLGDFQAALGAAYYANYNNVATPMGSSVVHIGLGSGNSLDTTAAKTLNFGIGSMTADVKVANNNGLLSNTGVADTNTAGTYGSMAMSNFKVAMNGWVNIGTH